MTTKTIKRCECGSRHILFADNNGMYCEKCMPVESKDEKVETGETPGKKPLKPEVKL